MEQSERRNSAKPPLFIPILLPVCLRAGRTALGCRSHSSDCFEWCDWSSCWVKERGFGLCCGHSSNRCRLVVGAASGWGQNGWSILEPSFRVQWSQLNLSFSLPLSGFAIRCSAHCHDLLHLCCHWDAGEFIVRQFSRIKNGPTTRIQAITTAHCSNEYLSFYISAEQHNGIIMIPSHFREQVA